MTTTPGTPAPAPSRAQHDEWVRYVREIGYTHKRIRHDQQTAEQRAAWGHDDWHCICGSWGGPFGDYAYALHLEDVIREASAPITVEDIAMRILSAPDALGLTANQAYAIARRLVGLSDVG